LFQKNENEQQDHISNRFLLYLVSFNGPAAQCTATGDAGNIQ
jgi:hypothetical protein